MENMRRTFVHLVKSAAAKSCFPSRADGEGGGGGADA